MILTPVDDAELPGMLAAVAARLADGSDAARVFARIRATADLIPLGVDTPAHRAAAVDLAHRFGIATIDEEPMQAFSWDGRAIRTRSEASVIVHEVAHWLLSPPERQGLPDFGLGAGPETGRRAEAEAAKCVDLDTMIEEEALSSLLGILWEVELGQPAILAFLEQNWLEGWQRPACVENLETNLMALRQKGLIDAEMKPLSPDCFHAAMHN